MSILHRSRWRYAVCSPQDATRRTPHLKLVVRLTKRLPFHPSRPHLQLLQHPFRLSYLQPSYRLWLSSLQLSSPWWFEFRAPCGSDHDTRTLRDGPILPETLDSNKNKQVRMPIAKVSFRPRTSFPSFLHSTVSPLISLFVLFFTDYLAVLPHFIVRPG